MLASVKDSRDALTNASSARSAGTLFCACAIDAASKRTSTPARRAIIDIERPPRGHDSPSEHPCEAVSDHTAGRVRLQSRVMVFRTAGLWPPHDHEAGGAPPVRQTIT